MLLRLTISELITLLYNQETAKINSINNNRTILATSTESTTSYLKKTIGFFEIDRECVNQSLSPLQRFSTLYYNSTTLS